MEVPSSSNITPSQQPMEAEMEIEQASLKRRHPDEDTEMAFELSDGSEDNARNHFTQHERHGLQYQPEPDMGVFWDYGGYRRHMGFGKKRKLNCGHALRSVDYLEDEISNSSNISVSSRSEEIYVEPRYVAPTSENYPNINPTNYFEPGPMTYKNEENFMYGHWILFTNVLGGWSYKFVKVFLRRQLGLICKKGRPLPGTQPAKDDFRIIVRLGSKEERDRILEYLLTKHVTHYFMHSIIDELPVGSFDSDSENEDDSGLIGVLQHLD
ncbi:unnamed protein product, partial [Brenthis ino]